MTGASNGGYRSVHQKLELGLSRSASDNLALWHLLFFGPIWPRLSSVEKTCRDQYEQQITNLISHVQLFTAVNQRS